MNNQDPIDPDAAVEGEFRRQFDELRQQHRAAETRAERRKLRRKIRRLRRHFFRRRVVRW